MRNKYKDIYDISLGFCSEQYWVSNTWSSFFRMVEILQKEIMIDNDFIVCNLATLFSM